MVRTARVTAPALEQEWSQDDG